MLFTPALEHVQRPGARPGHSATKKINPHLLYGFALNQRCKRAVGNVTGLKRRFNGGAKVIMQPAFKWQGETPLGAMNDIRRT